MRAARITTLDGPSAVLVEDVAEPHAADDVVLVDVHAAGVTFPDLLLCSAQVKKVVQTCSTAPMGRQDDPARPVDRIPTPWARQHGRRGGVEHA